jgi:hypothetical protein
LRQASHCRATTLGPFPDQRVPVVTNMLMALAADTDLGSWLQELQEVAPFLVAWERPYVRNVQVLLHLKAMCLSKRERDCGFLS